LKDNDSELWRQAGDARYYDGQWAEALLRYEKALEVDPIESYFVDFKAAFSRLRIGEGRPNDSGFRRASALSRRIATVGDALASAGRHRAAQVLFRAAKRVCWMTFDADRWLALYANQRGDYAEAAMRLEGALAWIPEDPRVRLNLVANQVFGLHGALGEDAIRNLRAALFHGGPEILDRFAIQVTNTRGRDALVLQARELLEAVAREREQWLERRGQVQAPEQHGGIIHIEIR
jgi:tetratricopeptide (TPR) repeat protein